MRTLSHVNPKCLVPTPEDHQCDDGNGWSLMWLACSDPAIKIMIGPRMLADISWFAFHMQHHLIVYPDKVPA